MCLRACHLQSVLPNEVPSQEIVAHGARVSVQLHLCVTALMMTRSLYIMSLSACLPPNLACSLVLTVCSRYVGFSVLYFPETRCSIMLRTVLGLGAWYCSVAHNPLSTLFKPSLFGKHCCCSEPMEKVAISELHNTGVASPIWARFRACL